ncbi:MAG: TIGR02300 family protein [Paracoccaceae bacterium]|nr:TIGR02300 family protein [Paracoccaceae bacterium]
MPKEEWGTKRVCPTTGKRFYDLNKTPIVSPYTGEVVNLDGPKTRTTISEKTSTKAPASDAEEVEEVEEEVLLDDDDDDDDDDLLEDDEDDNVSLDDIADVSGDEDES